MTPLHYQTAIRNVMTNCELKNINPEDISDVLIKIEKSFGFNFGENELMYITTFGELCDHITNKIQLDNSDDCTSQQAFYKLRNAILSILQIDNKTISTDLLLTDVLPKPNRRSRIKELEKILGFQLNILRPPHWVTGTLMIIFLVALGGLYFNWQMGLLGIILSLSGSWFANKTGNEFNLQTVGQVAKKMTKENYLKSRRNPKTFNKGEIETIVTNWFSSELTLDKNKLTRDAKFA